MCRCSLCAREGDRSGAIGHEWHGEVDDCVRLHSVSVAFYATEGVGRGSIANVDVDVDMSGGWGGEDVSETLR